MKVRFLLCGLVLPLLGSLVAAQDGGLRAPRKLSFDGETYLKAFEDRTATGELAEYLRKGDRIERWEKILGLYEFVVPGGPQAFAEAMAANIRKGRPGAKCTLRRDPRDGSVLLAFVTWPSDGSYAEFNVWKFRPADRGEGVLALQYARRAYRDVEKFLADLAREEPRVLALMARKNF